MDQFVAVIWDAAKCLCNCTARQAAFIYHLEENLQSLEEHWTQLQNRSQDVMQMIQQAESRPHMGRKREVDGWLQTVNNLEKTVTEIRKQGDKVVRDKCLGKFCHKNCVSSYNLGKDVVKTLDSVQELMCQGRNFNNSNISYELPREPEEMPVRETKGMDLMVEKVWRIIEAENVGIIGLCGMGGVGKTTLMKKVYNKFVARKQDFPQVMWVVVSQNYNVDKIIDDICESVHIDGKDKSGKDKRRQEKVNEIYNVMKDKKFVLLLDDMWEALDLESIGIPLPNETNQSKVLFTTRLKNVCHQMHAKMFKVECLKEEEAFDLFCMKVGKETMKSVSILELAQELVRECNGLPLALITLGRAMAGRENPKSWEHAIRMLKSSPSKDKCMEEEVLFVLKYSYDSLPSDMDRKCFLYLSLFPEDESICIHDLILLWIGEGLLGDDDSSIHDAFNHGHHLIETLKFACLVEDHEENSIKVHDMIRDMALWLLRDQDRNKNKILVQGEAFKLLQSHDNLENWEIVEKISIMHFGRFYIEISMLNIPICPHLKTLILKDLKINKLENIQFMSQLKVLRLIRVEGITIFPSEIGQLIHLEYLELSWCDIEKFPIDMKNLRMLKVFILQGGVLAFGNIFLDVISCLERLRVLKFIFPGPKANSSEEELFLEQLELLPHLEDISMNLSTPSGINKLLSSAKLHRCVRYLIVGDPFWQNPGQATIIPSVTKLERLEHAEFVGVNVSWEESLVNHIDIFSKLTEVWIHSCNSITHLTWLMHAPLLRTLRVKDCCLLEEVIMENKDNGYQNMYGIFADLERMYLLYLPHLRSIYKRALPFPKLKHISVSRCTELKKLPLDSNSAKYLENVRGSQEWLNNLEWEDPTVRDLFLPKVELWSDRDWWFY